MIEEEEQAGWAQGTPRGLFWGWTRMSTPQRVVSEHLLSAQRATRAGLLSLSTSPGAVLGPPDPSPPSPAPPSAPSPLMTARWRALSTMSSIPGQAAPRRLAAASPAGGPTMWMQVWATESPGREQGQPEPRLLPLFAWRLSHRFPHCQWHQLAGFSPPNLPEEGGAGRRTEQRLGCHCGQQSYGHGRREPEASDALQWGWGFLFKAISGSFSWSFCRKVGPAL